MAEILSSEKIQELVEKIIEDKLENYFRMSRPGFEIVSGHKVPGHDIGEFCMTTDTAQGIHFYEDGQCKMSSKKSIEIYSGDKSGEEDFSIVIQTSHGDVKISAKKNDVVIEGKTIMIHASDHLQLRSDRLIEIGAPTVSSISNNLDLIGISAVHLLGGETDVYGETQVEISEGVDLLLNTDIVTRLTNLSDEIKKLLIFNA